MSSSVGADDAATALPTTIPTVNNTVPARSDLAFENKTIQYLHCDEASSQSYLYINLLIVNLAGGLKQMTSLYQMPEMTGR
jgi:hypothetical protein